MRTPDFVTDIKVGGKTPDEIKKGLTLCYNPPSSCDDCPYFSDASCTEHCVKDALAYSQQLESRLAQAERERDALMFDLKMAIYRGRSFNLDCEFCKDKEKPVCNDCHWQWRGVCEQNTKGEDE